MVANIITDVTDWIDDISSNWWFLIIVFAIALLDSVIPVVPSETTVIAGGVAAGAGNQQIGLVILAGAAGAFIGDNIAYSIGRRFGPRVRRWAERKPDRERRLDRAADQIRKRGGPLLITARFIPGGRTVLTVSSGLTGQPRRWFMFWIAIAAVIWASYAALPRLRVRRGVRGQPHGRLPARLRRGTVDHRPHRAHPVGSATEAATRPSESETRRAHRPYIEVR